MEQIEISICLGSSCFARGNQKIVHMVKEYLKEKRLEQRVFLKGAHCFNACKNGPTIRINEELIQDINQDNVIELITKSLEKHDVKI